MTDRKDDSVQITRKSPVRWFDLRSLLDVGLLAAISATTDKRMPRREVLAALDIALDAPPYADYSTTLGPEVWLDYVADLGDGFDATHSVAWLIGRDYLCLDDPGKAVEQPTPPNDHQECTPADFGTGAHLLPAGKITLFGGDMVYPYATQTAYEDRTFGPYYAARPWQLTDQGESDARHLFAIPGNHDWYDGLGAFVQRFCQPGRWMGCWEVQQRRSYFAIKLPHQVWVWGVDLATDEDFDAPQLEYFKARARDLASGDMVILCVPAPAWVYRKRAEGSDATTSRSWDSWNKIDMIKHLVDSRNSDGPAPRICAILSGDLHHYSRYETRAAQDGGPPQTHLITCGGGGAYLLGTQTLPTNVQVGKGTDAPASRKATFPTPEQSRTLARRPTNFLGNNWQLFAVLGALLLVVIWYLDTASKPSLLDAVWSGPGGVGAALLGVLRSSPLSVIGLAALAQGFVLFARSDSTAPLWKAIVAGLLHFVGQLVFMTAVAALVIKPLFLTAEAFSGLAMLALMALVGLLALVLGWAASGMIFAIYLPCANALLGLHREEVFSAKGIADWKCFLRIRVTAEGITLFPIGLKQVCHDWVDVIPKGTGAGPLVPARPDSLSARMGLALRRIVETPETYVVPKGATHLLRPKTPLAPHLIETPIEIRRSEAMT